MAKTRQTRKLPKKEDTIKPPFNMAEPNDDLHAFGWSLSRMRYPAKDSSPDDVWPGASVFHVPESDDFKNIYGFNVEFANPAYLQFLLDCSPAVRKAALRCQKLKYSPESIANLRKVITTAFKDTVVPDMTARFVKIAQLVAEFYAARLAHIQTFGEEAVDD
jgi:hypothetical protein